MNCDVETKTLDLFQKSWIKLFRGKIMIKELDHSNSIESTKLVGEVEKLIQCDLKD